MRRIYNSAAMAAVLLYGAWVTTTTSTAASEQRAPTSARFEAIYGLPGCFERITTIHTMWVTTTATPYIMVSNSSECVLQGNLQEHAFDRRVALEACAGHQPPAMGEVATQPSVSSRSKATAGLSGVEFIPECGGIRLVGVGQVLPHCWGTPVEQFPVPARTGTMSHWGLVPMQQVPLQVPTIFNASFDGRGNRDRKSHWTRYTHEAPTPPDGFMSRFITVYMYLADVIHAEHISAFLFGRWPPRYYQRVRANRFDRRRRRRRRRCAMYAVDIGMMLRNAWRTKWDSLCAIADLPGPTEAPLTSPLESPTAEPTALAIAASSPHAAYGPSIGYTEVCRYWFKS